MIRTVTVLTACLLAFCGVVSAQPADPPPSSEAPLIPPGPPNELVALAYSPTAGALRWERGDANRLVTGYEITRGGRVLGVVDALSYVERSLRPGTSYRYRVVAIDIEGLRSRPVFVTLDTPDGSEQERERLAAANLRAEVYSPTAAELFWDRSATPGLSYQVRRGGALIGTTNGTSFFDDGLTGGTTFDYNVLTIVSDRVVGFSAVQLTTPGGRSDTGTDPAALPQRPVQVELEPVADKVFRISWQPSDGVEFYRVLENPDGASGFTPISADLDASTRRFDQRVALYARVNARYLVQACNGSGCADSDEVAVSGTLERAVGYFKADNTDAGDSFGRAVALSADGDTLAVGANGESDAATGIDGNRDEGVVDSSGAVYVFARIDGAWRQQAYVKANSPDRRDYFGSAVSLSADGDTLAVGAYEEDSAASGVDGDETDNAAPASGAVYVFARNDGNWQRQAYVKASTAPDMRANDFFGGALSLDADGDTLAIGALGEDSAASEESDGPSGATYVFVRVDGVWRQQARLIPDGRSISFGRAVSLDAAGDVLAVGTGVEGEPGAVRVFVRSGGDWRRQAELNARGTDQGEAPPDDGSGFGRSVSLSGDGTTLAVGEPLDDSAATGVNGDREDDSAPDSGAVHVFARSDGGWRKQAYLKASKSARDDRFGAAVSLSADGDTLAVGARREDSAAVGVDGDQNDLTSVRSGAVYVFARRDGNWQQRAYLKPSNTDQDLLVFSEVFGISPDDYSPDQFGEAVSLSADGDSLAIGATGENSAATGFDGDQQDESKPQSGAVYLY